jgi:ribosomal protein L11 methyltransferase
MNYIELNIPVKDQFESEMLVAELAELPFDSFEEDEDLLKAYIPADKLPDNKAKADAVIAARGITGQRYIEIETQNWNSVWEAQFDPVDVEGKLLIRAPFHAPCCDGRVEIIIMPKMSFGTGHHATTYLMSAEMTDHDFVGKRVLDMGSGTGVLAILAAKMGAASVDAIDIDEWAYQNSIENIEANGVQGVVHPIMGDAGAIVGKSYDTVLANINRNILLADMPRYVATLNHAGGELIMSGILERDIEIISEKAVSLGMWPAGQRLREGWAVVTFRFKD